MYQLKSLENIMLKNCVVCTFCTAGFPDSVDNVTVIVAISFISTEQVLHTHTHMHAHTKWLFSFSQMGAFTNHFLQARLNLKSEWKGEDFDECQKQATAIWDSVLSQVAQSV